MEDSLFFLNLTPDHICQNLYLSAESIADSVYTIGAFYDEEINGLLAADGEEQFVIYVATVGKKR